MAAYPGLDTRFLGCRRSAWRNVSPIAWRLSPAACQASAPASPHGSRAEGARVSLWDHDAAALAKADAPHKAASTSPTPKPCSAPPKTRPARSGQIDILIACAGITGPNATVWDYPVADWDTRDRRQPQRRLLLQPRRRAAHAPQRDYGRIVNIASIAGKEGNPNAAAYSASKAGVIGLTKSLGKELAKTNIRVNCVTPAAVRTPIFDQMTQEQIDWMLSKIPIGRFGEIDEVASLVCWLASEECSFSTGGVFDISGGRATY